MNDFISIVLPFIGLIVAVVVMLTAEPKTSKRLAVLAGGMALIGGLVIYSYGYINQCGDYLQGVIHSIFSVCRMFLGDADFGELDNADELFPHWVVTVNWLLHVLAVYATSSAAIAIIGASALKKLRFRFSRKPLNIIYGVHEATVRFGLELLERNPSELLVFVSEDVQTYLSDSIAETDAILRTDTKALAASEAFLKSIGMGKKERKLTLYALHPDYDKNFEYADALRLSMKAKGIDSKRISLVIHGKEEECIKHLQIDTDTKNPRQDPYGYGFVTVFRENDLAVRLLMQEYPPCSTVSFKEDCTAAENFEALIIGFGQLGQLVLRNVIMNGQFIGSTFRADVFESDIRECSGHFINCFPAVMSNYRVEFHSNDGRSQALYAHLTERLDFVKYIVVCTGNVEADEEIAEQLQEFISRKRRNIPVYRCSTQGVKVTDPDTTKTTVYPLYHPDVLATGTLDLMAMAVNQYYNGEYSKGAVEDWMGCDYFSRQSNRACADFIPAMLKAAGQEEAAVIQGEIKKNELMKKAKEDEKVVNENWNFTDGQLTVLGQMEHARWNAFHFCNGYVTMSDEEFESRAAAHRKEKAETGTGKTRISKNTVDRTHACLISWDALNKLDEKEIAVTGKNPTYQQKDKNNVNLIPTMLLLKNAAAKADSK